MRFRVLPVNCATPKLREFSKRLIAHETAGTKGASNNPAAFPPGEKLREPLATLMGMAGFRALLQRAIALAGAEVPWLRAVQVRADGMFEIAGELEVSVEKIGEGRVVLLAQMLGLLVAFIGEILTLRLVRETWPKLPPGDVDFN